MTSTNTRFSWQESFADTTDDTDVVASLFAHLAQWKLDHPEYVVQDTVTQYDVVRYPRGGGGPYGEIIWYAQAVEHPVL